MKPLGLTQQDYEELESPRQRGEAPSPVSVPTGWDKCPLWLLLTLSMVILLFLCVGALLCRVVKGRWPESL